MTEEQTIERMTTLLMSSDNAKNYYACERTAKWVFEQAKKVGWSLEIIDKPPDIDSKPLRISKNQGES